MAKVKKKEVVKETPMEKVTAGGGIVLPNAPERICCFCKKPLKVGLTLFNEDELYFKYAPANQGFHVECYFEHAIETIIENKVKERIKLNEILSHKKKK